MRTAILPLGAATVLLVTSVLSPVLLSRVDFGVTDWARVGNIGQAYGAASSALSALALAGVSVSVFMQARQNHIARVQAVKQLRVMLTRLALSDADLGEMWWSGVSSESDTERKQMLLADLMLLHWQTAWQISEMSDDSVRAHAGELFRAQVAAGRFWSQVRLHRTNVPHSEADNRFSRLIDDAYRAVSTPATGADRSGAGERFLFRDAYDAGPAVSGQGTGDPESTGALEPPDEITHPSPLPSAEKSDVRPGGRPGRG